MLLLLTFTHRRIKKIYCLCINDCLYVLCLCSMKKFHFLMQPCVVQWQVSHSEPFQTLEYVSTSNYNWIFFSPLFRSQHGLFFMLQFIMPFNWLPFPCHVSHVMPSWWESIFLTFHASVLFPVPLAEALPEFTSPPFMCGRQKRVFVCICVINLK